MTPHQHFYNEVCKATNAVMHFEEMVHLDLVETRYRVKKFKQKLAERQAEKGE